MTLEEAQSNIGKPFKWLGAATGCLLGQFDTIVHVGTDTGTVYGEWMAAHHDDCRLKKDQPEQLKRHDYSEETISEPINKNNEIISDILR